MGSDRARDARSRAAQRLNRLAEQWRPGPGPDHADPAPTIDPWQALFRDDEPPISSPPSPVDPLASGRTRLVGWSPSAVRGVAVIAAITVAVAAWWLWSGRPREAVAAPVVAATGTPVTGVDAAAVGADEARPSPAAPGAASTESATGGAPSPGADVVVVHVVGQVKRPGLVRLPRGSRVADAVEAAGGVTKNHAADSVNLARVLVDGEQVIVGFAAQAVAGALGIAAGPTTAALVNLNTADATTFENLPGVGPVLAERIVQWRTTNGPFRSVDELNEVSGIGDSIMGQIRPLVTV